MIRIYILRAIAILVGSTVLALAIYMTFRSTSEARVTIGVKAIDGYEEPAKASMGIWNSFVGCKFFIAGDDVLIKSDDGEPCGDPWRPKNEWDHAATAYRCSSHRSEILISHPGNIGTQACIIAHELGHVLRDFGIEHAETGVMGKCGDPLDKENGFLRVLDRDADAIRKAFCE